MLTEISINNFKAIAGEQKILLKPFNVLIGRNGSGKSSALEALNWLSSCIDDIIHAGENSFSISAKFDPQDLSIGDIIEYQLAVSGGNVPRIISEMLNYPALGEDSKRIITGDKGREYRLGLKGSISKRDRDLLRKRAKGDKDDKPVESILYALDQLEKQEFAAARNPDQTLLKMVDPIADRGGHLLREFLERSVFLRLSPRAIGRFTDDDIELAGRLLDEEGSQVAKLLEQLDNDSIQILVEKIGFVTGRIETCEVHSPIGPADRRYFEFSEIKDNGAKYRVPAWALSEGTRRITAILALLLHDSPPPLLCIEEIENGLDPWTIKFILEELSSAAIGDTQVILTTHSPHLLNYVPLESIILVNNEKGEITFTPGEALTGEDAVFNHMGVGDLYINRYLHEKTGVVHS
jgi:predicted ATPase